MTTHIERLIQQLDDSTGPSYGARAELYRHRLRHHPRHHQRTASLGGFGQLTAIEVFEEVGDPRCGPALIGLLDSDNPTVREWAAMALASLEIDGAVEPLRRAYRACLERATPPDWTEPGGIRWALTGLGARTPVVPPLTARLRATVADDAPGWPSAHFTEIINDLADHAQVMLHSQFWRVDASRTYGVSGPGLDWELDWTTPWEHLVEESRTWSLLDAPTGDNVFVAPGRDRPYRPVPGEVTDAIPAPRGSWLRPCGRGLRDEDVRRPPALPRTERRAVPGAPVVAHHTLYPAHDR